MNDILDIEKMRYTVRSYSDKNLEQEKLDKILEAGRWAPTAVNYQPQRIIVLNNDDTLLKVKEFTTFGYKEEYAKLTKECVDDEKTKMSYHYNARTALLVCYDNEVCWKHPENGASSGEVDATIVTTHMMLEAAAIGVGSSWISYFDKEKAKKLLDLPENIEPLVLLLLGYPTEESKPNNPMSGKRLPIEKTVFYNQYLK
ncbi:MAG: nitroreductase family protein [Clostridiaceae bacterium]